jgi:CDK-activating kinase assembly factor MAT1
VRTTPGLRFKISSKCYHKICETCIDRVFASGKQNCPIAGCKYQLWKRDWRYQVFEDLAVEREVDVRRRVMGILEKAENEFLTKRAYDDFLEMREEMIMNIVLDTDRVKTQRRLEAYALANGGSGKGLRTEGDADPSGLVRGLRPILAPPVVEAYDPFQGMPTTKSYYTLQHRYVSRWDEAAKKADFAAGGYDMQAFHDESLLKAFGGLGVFLDVEMARRDLVDPDSVKFHTKMEIDQVF